MTEIKKGLGEIIKEFRLESYLSKPEVGAVEEMKLFLIRKNPSFEEACNLDNNGRWRQAANHYYTIYSQTIDPLQKAKAFIGLSQMYINLVKYNLSRKFLLENKESIISSLSGWDKIFYEAQVFEKLGWINDYFGETDEAITNFSQARQLLSERAKIDNYVLRVYETSNHFLGRQYAILAWKEDQPQTDTSLAVERFKESVQIYEKLRAVGKPDDAAEGFQYGWLCRMSILQGDYKEAEDYLLKTHQFFTHVTKDRPGSGIMGYYYLLLGRLKLEQGDYQESRESFSEALRINTEVINYPSSQADAILGMGLSDYYLGNKEKAKQEVLKSLSINPSLLYRGYI